MTTPRNRFLTALRGGTPDRVPTFELEFNDEAVASLAALFTGDVPPLKSPIDSPPEENRRRSDLFFTVVEGLDLDAATHVLAFDARRLPGRREHFTDALGVVYRNSAHGDPFPVEGPVKTAADLQHLHLPDPHAMLAPFRHWRSQVRRRALVCCIPGPFKLSWSLMGGMQHLLLAYALDRTFCLELARICTDFIVAILSAAIEAGADAVLLDGDIADNRGTLMSPDHYRRYLKPFHHECIAQARARGCPVIKHTDGNFWPVLDDLLEVGFDGLHPIQPQCMDIAVVKAHVAGRACLIGNIDCMHLLPCGTRAEVRAAVEATIREVAPGGGYVIASSNSIHPGCDAHNVLTLFRAARQYGRYPIAVP